MKKDSSKTTILVITLGFMVVYLVFKLEWAIYIALIVGFLGASSKWLAIKIEWVWLKLADILSKIVPTILLTVIFYFFLFPIALFSRCFTNDSLLLKNNKNTTFKEVTKIDIKKNMEKTW